MNEITITITDKYSMQNYIDNYHYNSHDIKTIVIDKTYDGYLPENMAARNIIIMSKWITKLPKKLTCNYLDISSSSVSEIYSTNKISYSISAQNMENDLVLPDNLEVGSLDLMDSKGITSLPNNLRISAFLDIRGTSITHVPNYTYVGSRLFSNSETLLVNGYLIDCNISTGCGVIKND